MLLFPIGFVMGLWLIWYRLMIGAISGTTTILTALLIISGLQLLLFGMFFDMEASK